MKRIIAILFLLAVTLACGAPVAMRAAMEAPLKPVADPLYTVTAHALNFRTCGSLDCPADPKGLKQGQEVRVYLHCTGGEFADWVSIDYDCTRWVRSSWLEAK